jgi:hypothetical protein
MRWPFASRPRGTTELPPVPALPGQASTFPDRPSTFVELLSDLSKSLKQTATLVFLFGSIFVIASLCLMGVLFAVSTAAEGVRGIPVRYILSIGAGGASLVTFVTAVVTRRIKKLAKVVHADAPDDDKR